MPSPETPSLKAPSIKTLNKAYTCFLIAGVVSVVAFSLVAVNRYFLIWLLLLIVPLSPVIVALFAGIVMGLRFRRHRPLLLLALSPAPVVTAVVIAGEADAPEFATFALVLAIAWGAVMVIVPVWWFAKGRHRYMEELSPADQPMPLW